MIWDPYTAQANLTLKVRSIGSAENGYQFGSASVKALTDPQRNAALSDFWSATSGRRSGRARTPSSGPRSTPPPWV